MVKNRIPELEQGSQFGTMVTPDISHLTGVKKSFHYKPKPKRIFRLIYQQATDHWYFIEMPFGLYVACVKANMQPEKYSHGGQWL